MKLKRFHKITAAALAFLLLPTLPVTAFATTTQYEDAHTIVLSSEENSDGTYTNTATYDGEDVKEYDYTWGIDLTEAHDDVSNSPAEYYSGEEPTGEESVYIAHDIYYYPELDESGFVLQNYDGEQEWCYYYTIEGYEDYIFSTLPVSGSSIPTQMMHSAEDAYQNSVLHITEAGTYILEGEWHGQIWIDLGDDAFDDETCKVNIILNGVDVTCTVAPSLVFANVYECDNTWEDQTSWSYDVDTTEAGANVIIADDTENNFSGTNIFRILKTKFKSSDDTSTGAAQKKRLKIDGAFYSYMSMNIDGETDDSGVLNIEAGYEGLDTELHLTFNGGNVNITSGDDGINVNEDGVSVIAVNDGSLHIVAGTANEGDGIDSNGYLVINGGTVITTANPNSDSGMDSDSGSYVNGGYVVATGSTMDSVNSNSSQVTVDLQFASSQGDDEAIIFTDTDGNVVFAYDPDNDEVSGSNNRSYSGAIVSCPEFEEGATYYVYVGGDVYGTDVSGLYDVTTVTGFSDEAVQQCYTGTGSSDPGGDSGFGGDDSGFGGGDSGFGGGDSGFGGGDSGFGGGSSSFGSLTSLLTSSLTAAGDNGSSNGTIEFVMSATVNTFSQVTDYTGSDSDSSATPTFPEMPTSEAVTEATQATDESTEATDESTEATDESTEATEESTEVTEASTEAAEETQATDETDSTAQSSEETQESTELAETTQVTEETGESTTEAEDAFLLGDVNLDGFVTVADATLAQKFIVGSESLSNIQFKAADIDGDGTVNITDATLIQKIVTGLYTVS